MEGRLIADAEDMAVQDAGILGISRRSRRLNDMASDLRARLKAYQEQRRALERRLVAAIRAFDEMDAAMCGAASLDQLCSHYGMKSAQRIVHARMQIDLARAALNQKGAER